MVELIKRILSGKKVTEELNLTDALAVITDEDGKSYEFFREGYAIEPGIGGLYIIDGRSVLERYISDSKRQVLVADNGNMIPTCRIKNIVVTEFNRKVKRIYRSGGLLGDLASSEYVRV